MSPTGKVAVALACAGAGLGAVALAESPAARAASAQLLARIGAREMLLDSARAFAERAVSVFFDGHPPVPTSRTGVLPS